MQEDFWARLLLAVLAVWRVTHLLACEDGPADLVVRFRAHLGRGLLGKLMDCFNCLSLWVAAPLALYVTRKPLDWLFAWLAISGAACVLERLGREPIMIQPLANPGEGDSDDVLRPETIDVADHFASGDHADREANPS